MCYYTDQQSSKNTLEKRFEAFAKFQELELAKGNNRASIGLLCQLSHKANPTSFN